MVKLNFGKVVPSLRCLINFGEVVPPFLEIGDGGKYVGHLQLFVPPASEFQFKIKFNFSFLNCDWNQKQHCMVLFLWIHSHKRTLLFCFATVHVNWWKSWREVKLLVVLISRQLKQMLIKLITFTTFWDRFFRVGEFHQLSTSPAAVSLLDTDILLISRWFLFVHNRWLSWLSSIVVVHNHHYDENWINESFLTFENIRLYFLLKFNITQRNPFETYG